VQKNNNTPESSGALQLALILAPPRAGEDIHRPGLRLNSFPENRFFLAFKVRTK
jgi:hypothetical protein